MPFVDDSHRAKPDPLIAGDRCYVHYKKIMELWRQNPRWTTIDNLWSFYEPNDEKRALLLALLVHFVFHGIPYEEKKQEENGDI